MDLERTDFTDRVAFPHNSPIAQAHQSPMCSPTSPYRLTPLSFGVSTVTRRMMRTKTTQDSLDELHLAWADLLDAVSNAIYDLAERVWFLSIRISFKVEKRRRDRG